jgi:hypothetical protein
MDRINKFGLNKEKKRKIEMKICGHVVIFMNGLSYKKYNQVKMLISARETMNILNIFWIHKAKLSKQV